MSYHPGQSGSGWDKLTAHRTGPGLVGGTTMRMTMTWLRLELPRRWRSLALLALLIALATATVLTAVAGARRGDTAGNRLYPRALPATVTVLPTQPGFDWNKVRALPQVEALSRFAVSEGGVVKDAP